MKTKTLLAVAFAFGGVAVCAVEEKAKDICPVHQIKMQKIEAAVVSAEQGEGWRSTIVKEFGSYEIYEEAAAEFFPFAQTSVYWSPELKMPQAFQKYICSKCVLARTAWLKTREAPGPKDGHFPIKEELKEVKAKPELTSFVVHTEDEQRDEDAATDLYRHLGIYRWILHWKPSEKAESFNVYLWRVDRGPDGIKKQTRLAAVSGECEKELPQFNIRIMVDKNSSTLCNYGRVTHGAGFVPSGPVSFSKGEPRKIGMDRYLLIEVMDQVKLANGTRIPGGVIQSLEVSVEEK